MILSVKKSDARAVIPEKAHPSDVGYDLTIIDIVKRDHPNIIMYDTGIAVNPGDGFYTEIVPRSSFYKTGHLLANSVGIIDPDYRGTLKIVVVKILNDMPDLPLPYKGFQLIVRSLNNSTLKVVEDLNETVRGDGGFGSTSK